MNHTHFWSLSLSVCLALLAGCAEADGTLAQAEIQEDKGMNEPQQSTDKPPEGKKFATFGAGCFWCVEAVYQRVDGVELVESGYEGGSVKNPTYEQVCSGFTGHAEVCRLTYDPKKVSFEQLLEVFWKTHDPTTLNQQGNDIGTQYRSVVFYHDDEQKKLAEEYKKKLDAAGAFSAPIVTEISATSLFYKAEKYHQNYFNDNPQQSYCRFVVKPKVEKFEKVFGKTLSKSAKD